MKKVLIILLLMPVMVQAQNLRITSGGRVVTFNNQMSVTPAPSTNPLDNALFRFDGSFNATNTGFDNINGGSDALFIDSRGLQVLNTTNATLTLSGTYEIDNILYDSDIGTDLTGFSLATRTITLTSISNNDIIWNLRIYNSSAQLVAHFPIVSGKKICYDIVSGSSATIGGAIETDYTWTTQNSYHYSELNTALVTSKFKGSYAEPVNENIVDFAHTDGDWTVNVWFVCDSFPAAVQQILYFKDYASNDFELRLNTATNRRPLVYHGGALSSFSQTSIEANELTLLTVVIDSDGANTTYRYYINGDSTTTTVSSSTLREEVAINNILLGTNNTTTKALSFSGNVISISEYNGSWYLSQHSELWNNGQGINDLTHAESANLVMYNRDLGRGNMKDFTWRKNHLALVDMDTKNIYPGLNDTTTFGLMVNKGVGFKGTCNLSYNSNTWNLDSVYNYWTDVRFADHSDYSTVTDWALFTDTVTWTDQQSIFTTYNYNTSILTTDMGQSNDAGVQDMDSLWAEYSGAQPEVQIYTTSGFDTLDADGNNNNQYYLPGNFFSFNVRYYVDLAAHLGTTIKAFNFAQSGAYLDSVAAVDWSERSVNDLFDKMKTAFDRAYTVSSIDNELLLLDYTVWYQGEADAGNTTFANNYETNFRSWTTAYNNYIDSIPNVYNNITWNAALIQSGSFQATVRAAITTIMTELGGNAIETNDLYHYDGVHLGNQGMEDFTNRLILNF